MTRLDRVAFLAIVASAALGVGCQSPDVGQRCIITWNATSTIPAPRPDSIPGDYLETGNLACDSLVCIVSPATDWYSTCEGEACGYCSKPCVSDTECYTRTTGLVCRQMVLDPEFIAQLDPLLADRYLGDARYSRYCAVPLE